MSLFKHFSNRAPEDSISRINKTVVTSRLTSWRMSWSEKYAHLIKFLGLIATLSPSNAGVERTCSSLKLIKTEGRGSMEAAISVGLMQTLFSIQSCSTYDRQKWKHCSKVVTVCIMVMNQVKAETFH